MDKVRLAIVGCGTISQLNAPGYLQHEKCDVVALCDPILERAESRAREWGISPMLYTRYEDVLNDPEVDAVELLTPTPMHAEQIVAGLDAGKHVSCQKPISATVAEADKVIAAVRRSGKKFRVTENFVFYPPLVKAKELLDGGAIGEPTMARVRTVGGLRQPDSTFAIGPDAMTWRRDSTRNPGGQLYDDGWHKYATLIWWLGDVEKVYAMVTKDESFIVETPAVITLKFAGRPCLGVMDYSRASEMPMRTKYYTSDEFFEIQGSRGAIWVTRCTGEWLDMPPVMLVKGSETTSFQVPMDWIEGFNGSARNFIDSILSDEQPDLDVHFSKKVLQAILAGYEAARLDRPVAPSAMT